MRIAKRIISFIVLLSMISISALAVCIPGAATAHAYNSTLRAVAYTVPNSTCTSGKRTLIAQVKGTYSWYADPYSTFTYTGDKVENYNQNALSVHSLSDTSFYRTVKNEWSARCSGCGAHGSGTTNGSVS